MMCSRLKPWYRHARTMHAGQLFGFFVGLLLLGSLGAQHVQADPPPARAVRAIDPSEWGVPKRAGLTYSANLNQFFLVKQGPPGESTTGGSTVVALTPYEQLVDTVQLDFVVDDATNAAFDDNNNRLLLLNSHPAELVQIDIGNQGKLDPATMTRFDLAALDLQSADGIDVDQESHRLFILDRKAQQLVQVTLTPAGPDNATLAKVDLGGLGFAQLRGLALNPANRHLYAVSKDQNKLVEFTQDGQLVATHDLSALQMVAPRELVFAPSPDLTDPAETIHLFVIDSKQAADQVTGASAPQPGWLEASITRLYLPLVTQSTADETALETAPDATPEAAPEAVDAASKQRYSEIIEVALDQPNVELSAASANVETEQLIHTIDTAAFSPPSPDPSGMTYLPATNTLLMSDGEVEETVSGITYFAGANLWEMTLGGSVVRTANISKKTPTVAPMTNEPTGVAWNPSNGHYYVTDDDATEVYDLNPGADRLIGTADDTWTSFDTAVNNNMDPEGITYASGNNHIFVSDGVNAEIYEYTTAGALVNHFDVAVYGVSDNESVEYNPDSGTLFVLSNVGNQIIVETTTSGALVGTYNFAAAGATAPAGLAYAPASNGSGVKRFYIADRRVDNNSNPNENDGKIYEMTAPSATGTGNVAPIVNAGPDQTVTLPANGQLNGTVTDDGLPNPPGATTVAWNLIVGPGTVTFANANASSTTATFSDAGTYLLRLTATDGQASSNDDVQITVNGNGSTATLNVRVAASSDDAEESASGSVSLTSSDLELVYDGSNQTVGLRFNGIAIPRGAAIVNAYVQFQVDEIQSEATSLTIQGQAIDNAATFGSSSGNISSRGRTAASVAWSPPPWTTVDASGPDQRTPNLAAVIQEIVSRPAWSSGNALAIIITGTGHRTARASDIGVAVAPLLHVEYATGTPTATDTPTNTPTSTPVPTATSTNTPVATNTPTSTSTNTPISTPTNTPVPTATPTNTPVPTSTPMPTATSTSTPVPPTPTSMPDGIFADSFEAGNLSAWSSSATDKGNLSVSTAAKLVGNYGMQALINDNKAIYVTDDRPAAEPRYRARFYFDPNSITMTSGNAHYIFYGFNAAGTAVLRVELRRSSNAYEIRTALLNDSTSFTNSAWFPISDAPHPIEVDWRASTAAGANNGGLTLWIDGVQQANLTGVDNDTRRIDSVRLGAVAGIDTGTRGTYYFDAFESRRQTYIGP